MSILSFADWLQTPQGRYLQQWEQTHFDLMVADIFGYNAVQIGLPAVDLLRNNRMPFRICCTHPGSGGQVVAQPHALPFESGSVDLLLLPHVLEFDAHPHQVLREVARVLVPEGSVIISGFNPYSLWGMRRLMAGRQAQQHPWCGQYLSVRRMKDWFALLDLEPSGGVFGCYTPPVSQDVWLQRWAFMDRAGDRWWPIFGAGYLLHAVKRVTGMRLITPKWKDRRAAARLAALAGRDRRAAQRNENADLG